jgi:ABC-type multidrug transport system ATPase subunit
LVDTNRRFCFQRHIAILKPAQSTPSKFLFYLMGSPAVFRAAWSRVTGSAQPTLPLGNLRSIPIQIPSFREQQEIARRVEALFVLADQVEARFKNAQACVNKLTQSLLAEAFRGELVPQHPDDEPAEVLLKRLKATAAQVMPTKFRTFTSPKIRRTPKERSTMTKSRYDDDVKEKRKSMRLSNRTGRPSIDCDGRALSRTEFDEHKSHYFPDLVFGYYSGDSRRLERLFDDHQRRYYNVIKRNDDLEECRKALDERRLFYCRSIHGNFALLSFFAFPAQAVKRLLEEKLGVTGFHSALALLREPWFSESTRKTRLTDAVDLWGALGPAGKCARAFRDHAFHPIAFEDRPIDDYRDKGGSEAQLGTFLRNEEALDAVAKNYANEREFFAALEAMDISDLVRDLYLWVKRTNNESGDVSFSDLSDGERQLLMVLGLIRVSRGKRALFLLDEPDTHLNPHWQHTYLDLIREWTEVASFESLCHIVMASHNPLTIAALQKEEVRVMVQDETGKLTISPPYTDPRGMGFTATLTEIFGLPTTLDAETQRAVDTRNELAQIAKRSEEQERELIAINDKLNRLGFMFEDREPLYNEFLQAWKDVRYEDRPPLTPDQVEARRKAMSQLIKGSVEKKGAAA